MTCPELKIPKYYLPIQAHKQRVSSSKIKSVLYRNSEFDIFRPYSEARKTSIICTIGPKTKSVEALRSLVRAGMNIVRLNFSHGSHEYHAEVIANLNTVRAEFNNRLIGLALDTKGPEIRTGMVKSGGEIKLDQGAKLTVTTDCAYKDKCDEKLLYIDYTNLPKSVKVNDFIYIDDGLLMLKVTKIADDQKSVEVVALNSATISSRKGVNLPNILVNLPALSDKDRLDLQFGIKQGIDMIFASFIRKAQDVIDIRNAIGEEGKYIRIISKIENHEGIQKFDQILKESDGIMVARGDLGIEIPPHQVFLAQKMMIAKCNIAGKPVIVATQMLDSMTYFPRPTRAEVSDVANAVIDGADCVMLSGETAKGDYPCETVTIMSEICLSAESAFLHVPFFRQVKDLQPTSTDISEDICASAVQASMCPEIAAIITISLFGRAARLLSKYRPRVPILAVTNIPTVSRGLHLSKGLFPYLIRHTYDSEKMEDFNDYISQVITECMMYGQERKLIVPGDKIIVVQGFKIFKGASNTMRILTFSPLPNVSRR